MVQTSDGGYTLAGYTSSFSSDNTSVCWLIKVDSSGNLIWNRTYEGQHLFNPVAGSISLVQTKEGGYAILCFALVTIENETNSNFLVIKTDSDGYIDWSKMKWEKGHNLAYCIIQTTDDGYALAGESTSWESGDTDAFLIKLDSNGDDVWEKNFGGQGFDYSYSLVQTNDGGYALVGSTYDSESSISDIFMIKTDSYGNFEWNQTFGGLENEFGRALIQTSDGGYVIISETTSFGAGDRDFWLIKTDSLGNMEWNMTYGGVLGECPLALAQASDGGYAITGFTTSFGAGEMDVWLVKTDSFGNMQWNMTYGEEGHEQAWAIAEVTNGGYTVAGTTNSLGEGKSDALLIKIEENSVIQEFPSWIILPLFIIFIIVVIFCIKKLTKGS